MGLSDANHFHPPLKIHYALRLGEDSCKRDPRRGLREKKRYSILMVDFRWGGKFGCHYGDE